MCYIVITKEGTEREPVGGERRWYVILCVCARVHVRILHNVGRAKRELVGGEESDVCVYADYITEEEAVGSR